MREQKMIDLGKTIAFIPARGGSKSIPFKNIKKINGRPLIYWVIDAAINIEEIDRVVISTDDQEIKQVVSEYNHSKVLVVGRSEKVSTDTASTESVMIEFAEEYEFENIILIQATSPLLAENELRQGIQVFSEEKYDSVLSVVKQKRFFWEKNENSFANPLNYDPVSRPRRQEFDGFYVENGAFYITSKELLIESKSRLSGNIAMVEMSEDSYFEIDEISDWIIVENLLKARTSESDNFLEKLKNIRCVITDCDGVLTDGGMYYSENGDELKKFNTRDGMGFQLLCEKGYYTGMITGENSSSAYKRAKKLKMDLIYTGIKNKLAVLNEICDKLALTFDEIAYIGDDLNDLEVIKKVGFSCAVRDANEEVRSHADYITNVNGGSGAVREFIDIILNNQE
ncbi:HAD hydrolase family protein [Eubacteriaceae bacterium ES3]|nr:HAD hydrolase family protein [Eubacteriaceae bacterium ES3]